MSKKLLYVILGLIVAMIVIVECFSNTNIKSEANRIEKKIIYKIDKAFSN